MDGNGRWAQNRGLPRTEGHRRGVDVVKEIVKACIANNLEILSIWAFGSENWGRPIVEVNFLMDLFLQALKRELCELHEEGIRLCFTGNRVELDQELQDQMLDAETLTKCNPKLTLNVVFNYGGKWDIVEAAKQIALRVLDGELLPENLSEQMFATYLNTKDLPDPDLLIRTSGEQRISNFLLWQLAYTEFYFSEVLWPDFTRDNFEKALKSYSCRERRYGN